MSEFEMYTPPLYQSAFSPIPDDLSFNSFSMPLTPSDFGSADEGPLYSPRTSMAMPVGSAPEKTHATSGVSPACHQILSTRTNKFVQRRRAQNRAAQRAFRERKEKHARDLEVQLAELTNKYQSLETSHAELSAAYEKLQKTLELLTTKEDVDSGSAETLRKFLSILHGEIRIKAERERKS
jgi:AP-1-like factor